MTTDTWELAEDILVVLVVVAVVEGAAVTTTVLVLVWPSGSPEAEDDGTPVSSIRERTARQLGDKTYSQLQHKQNPGYNSPLLDSSRLGSQCMEY